MTPLDMIYAAILMSAKHECNVNYQYSTIVNSFNALADTSTTESTAEEGRKLVYTKYELHKLCGLSKWEKGEK